MSDSLIETARRIAYASHEGQVYPPDKGVLPFTMHLGHVVGVLMRFKHYDSVLIAAAWLHDVVEDSSMVVDDVRQELNAGASFWKDEINEVVNIVAAVTDEPGATRKERKAKTYPKIIEYGSDAITVKQADRIANFEGSIFAGSRHLLMYRQEHREFCEKLRPHGGDPAMWAHLEFLAALEPVDVRTE